MSYTEPQSSDEFNSLINSAEATIVDFYAEWCGPCKKFAPSFSTYANDHKVESKLHFMKVEADNENMHDIAKKYKINALPTMVVINKKGEEVKRMVGINKKEFEELLQVAKKSVADTSAVTSADISADKVTENASEKENVEN